MNLTDIAFVALAALLVWPVLRYIVLPAIRGLARVVCPNTD